MRQSGIEGSYFIALLYFVPVYCRKLIVADSCWFFCISERPQASSP